MMLRLWFRNNIALQQQEGSSYKSIHISMEDFFCLEPKTGSCMESLILFHRSLYIFIYIYIQSMVWIGGRNAIGIYAFLQDKRQPTYGQMLNHVSFLTDGAITNSINIDYERAAINATKDIYPNTNIYGCIAALRFGGGGAHSGLFRNQLHWRATLRYFDVHQHSNTWYGAYTNV